MQSSWRGFKAEKRDTTSRDFGFGMNERKESASMNFHQFQSGLESSGYKISFLFFGFAWKQNFFSERELFIQKTMWTLKGVSSLLY